VHQYAHHQEYNITILNNECESFLTKPQDCINTLCNLAGNEQELPEDDLLVLKHVGAINTEE
jgi:hypothetical protein